MKIEEVFQAKPEDPTTETALEQLAKLISGKVPCDEKGEVDWTELGALCGDKAKSVFDSCGVIVRDGDQANDVLIGTGISLLKVLYENRERLLHTNRTLVWWRPITNSPWRGGSRKNLAGWRSRAKLLRTFARFCEVTDQVTILSDCTRT